MPRPPLAARDPRPLAAVLAGGRSARMGAPKAAALLGDLTLLERALSTARAAGLDAVVVSRADVALPQVDAPVWLEPDEADRHPLHGVLEALGRAGGRPVVALAVDMPLVTPALLRALAVHPGPAAAFRAGGRVQPLPCRVAPEAAGALRAALARGAGVGAALAGAGAELLDAEDGAFLNVNRPEDVARAERLLAPPGAGTQSGTPGTGRP